MASPKLLVTRKLPDAVEARIRRNYDALLNEQDVLYGAEDLVRLAQGMDGVLTCGTERWSPDVVARLPRGVGIIASFSVGYEHIDVPACRARGIVATNTPDVLTEATADIAMLCLLGAARRAWEGETMLRDGRWRQSGQHDRAARARSARQGAGHRRDGSDRPGCGATCARFRPGSPLPQPDKHCPPTRRKVPPITRHSRICCRTATSCR